MKIRNRPSKLHFTERLTDPFPPEDLYLSFSLLAFAKLGVFFPQRRLNYVVETFSESSLPLT